MVGDRTSQGRQNPRGDLVWERAKAALWSGSLYVFGIRGRFQSDFGRHCLGQGNRNRRGCIVSLHLVRHVIQHGPRK